MRLFNGVGLAVLGLSVFSVVGQAQTQTTNFVAPGQSDEIDIPISNDPGSLLPLQNVHVIITAPAFFQIQSNSTLNVLPGDNQTLAITYQIANNAPSGPFTVGTRSVAISVDTTPPVTTLRVDGPLYVGAASATFVSPGSTLTLSAVDPGPNASGVARRSCSSLKKERTSMFFRKTVSSNGIFLYIVRGRPSVKRRQPTRLLGDPSRKSRCDPRHTKKDLDPRRAAHLGPHPRLNP